MASSCRSNVTRVAFRNVVPLSKEGCTRCSLLPLFVSPSLARSVLVPLSRSLSFFLFLAGVCCCCCHRCAFVRGARARASQTARANGKVNHAFYYRLRGIPENWRLSEDLNHRLLFSLARSLPSFRTLTLFARAGESVTHCADTYLSRRRSNLPCVFLVSPLPVLLSGALSAGLVVTGNRFSHGKSLVRFERAGCKNPDLFGASWLKFWSSSRYWSQYGVEFNFDIFNARRVFSMH